MISSKKWQNVGTLIVRNFGFQENRQLFSENAEINNRNVDPQVPNIGHNFLSIKGRMMTNTLLNSVCILVLSNIHTYWPKLVQFEISLLQFT
jgi:hypothetical protein